MTGNDYYFKKMKVIIEISFRLYALKEWDIYEFLKKPKIKVMLFIILLCLVLQNFGSLSSLYKIFTQ